MKRPKVIGCYNIDATTNDMKTRFSMESLKMAKSIDTFLDLQFDEDSYFVNHYKVINLIKVYIYIF